MIIVVEGPPKTGKTQLAERIAKKTQAEIVRNTIDIHQGNNLAYLKAFALSDEIEDYDPGAGEHLIFDEYSWVNLAYSQVFGAKKIMDSTRWFVEARLRTLGAVFVYVKHTPEEVRRRLYASNPFVQAPQRVRLHVDEICAAYDNVYESANITTCQYPKYDLGEIVTAAQRLAVHATTVSKWPGYIGHTAPKALIIDAEVQFGFGPCVPLQGSGMRYLLENVEPTLRDNLGYVNTALMTPESIFELHETLGSPPAVVLGKDLSKNLRFMGLQHSAVPSPKFVRRFHTKPTAGEQYGALIAQAVEVQGTYFDWRPDVPE